MPDLSKTFTDIRTLQIMNMCQIVTINLTANINCGQKLSATDNVKRLIHESGNLCVIGAKSHPGLELLIQPENQRSGGLIGIKTQKMEI